VTWPNVQALDPYTQFRIAADSTVSWMFFFMAWSAFYLAIQAQGQALTAQKRAAEAESAAQSAQLRALRYQVNPHFLFNTLNSLSSLVMTGRNDRAEAMLMALSTFFRSSLSLDPAADISLEQEIDLQRLYLEIEKTRFPDRLQVEIDVPDKLQSARLPALILQPIVENAIKYGVSKTRQKVLIQIIGEKLDGGRMAITVSNRLLNGRKNELPAATHEGTGLGLANVSERLETRFGNKASCRFGPMASGGYKVTLTMPVETNG
jgi:LytS/YehU family sensor histidine kinase